MAADSRVFRSSFGAIGGLLGFPLRQVDIRWLRTLGERLAPMNITTGRAAALYFIASNPGCSQTELGDALRINRPSTMRAVDELTAIGAIERRKLKANARNNALHLTPEGERLHGLILAEAKAHEAEYFAALTMEEREQLRALLLKML